MRLNRSVSYTKVLIAILLVFICLLFIRNEKLSFRHEHYEINEQRSRCCIADGVLDICGRPSCEKCQVGTTTRIEKNNKNVFFIETSKSATLNTRQACAVESTAVHNANLNISVLMTGQLNVNTSTMDALRTYDNIHFEHIELDDYFGDTPLERWYFCSTWNEGPYAVSHLSDALRFLTLFKYGGYYFDLDFVMLNSVEKYGNFLVPEEKDHLAAGAIHLEADHPLTQRAVEEFRSTYKRDEWGYNGPQLLTRVIKSWCSVDELSMVNGTCRGVNILPINWFYPVHWSSWQILFGNETKPENVTDALAVHMWNKLSESTVVLKESNQLYSLLAKEHCPRVYTVANHEF